MIRFKDLKMVPTKECGEPLLSIEEYLPEVIADYQNSDMYDYTGDKLLLRQGCIKRLREADKLLKIMVPNASLLIVYGYRHPALQQKYFDDQYRSIRQSFGHLKGEKLLEVVHQLIAVAEVAGHPTGGAIDVTLQIDDMRIDMGTGIADFNNIEKIPTFSNIITEKQKKNRMLLRSLLMQAGFSPHDGEWWHFSYGDKEWAYYYKQSHAIYEQIALNL